MSKDLPVIDMSNAKRIHIGLGKIQSRIMRIMEEEVKTWGMEMEGPTWELMDIEDLTSKVYYSDLRGVTTWMGDEYPITKSQINTVRRAVGRLEKRGLVTTAITFVESPKGNSKLLVGILSDKY